ncbi:hypothetical protein DIPPA_16906 [Diplonema papillatum]|nr:hypothetical protein DIPPA_16906 [Diplonema papillatum]
MTEQASKKRRVETEADREASPEAATMAAPPPVVNNATSSPSPTRGSPSPNRTPRPVGEEPVYRSQAPSLKDHGQLSPPRVPECSLPGESMPPLHTVFS